MRDFVVTKLDPSRWAEYKALRLESLVAEPYAFLGTFVEESAYGDSVWQERLINAQLPNSNMMLFAERAGIVVGMIGILCSHNEKNKHIARIVSFFVTPAERGKGIGKALLEKAIAAIQERGCTKIALDVTVTQVSAIQLYESLGFHKIGVLKNNIKIDDVYYDEYGMEKIIEL